MELKFLSAAALTVVVIYLSSFGFIAYNYPAYEKFIVKHSLAEHLAKFKTPGLLEYFQGKGELPTGFSPKEAIHLKDVQFFIQGLIYFLIVCVLLLIFIVDARSLFYGSILALIFPIILYLIPFDLLFNIFHQLFFQQGTWVFDINSVLVQMYPFEFFHDFFFSIVLRGWIMSAILLGLSVIHKKCSL